jgi:hypothetical protein
MKTSPGQARYDKRRPGFKRKNGEEPCSGDGKYGMRSKQIPFARDVSEVKMLTRLPQPARIRFLIRFRIRVYPCVSV